jgi:hypothetical protein
MRWKFLRNACSPGRRRASTTNVLRPTCAAAYPPPTTRPAPISPVPLNARGRAADMARLTSMSATSSAPRTVGSPSR